ncbi:ABC transporter substrate-binding protein [Zafaria sp. J156]|uniref:ABC transporter substrate-binding protein n=1 Tax=Zafaria sp. J156 TaxID=3116490 RepID=UPI002E7815B1|nr:extracellular solute-binding protein [Zafaria sp. J156]MEE1622573.1 extracellular solute-binding protein [Zafaria sp. J156]
MNNTVRRDLDTLESLKTRMVNGQLGRRGFLAGAMGLSATALLSACAGGTTSPSGASGSGSKVIPLYTVENDPATLAFYNMVIANFKKDHPDMDVKVTVYADANQLQYLTTAFQNNVDVGIFSPAVSSFPDFARAGHLAELDDLVQEIGEDDFLPGTRILVDGHDVAMPLQSNSSLVYYRKDLLESAGLSVPKTFEEYRNAVEALHGQNGINGIAMAVGPTPQLPLQFFAPYLYQSGHDYFDRDGQLTFNHPDVLGAVEKFASLMKFAPQSMYNAAFGDIVSAYSAGQAAFATFPGRLGAVLAERDPKLAENTGVMRIPAGDFMTGELHFGSSQQYALYSKTGNPEMAKEFLKRLTTGDDAVAFAKTVPGHLLPPLKSVLAKFEEEVRNPQDEFFTKHGDWVQTFMDCAPNAMTASVSMGAVVDGAFERKITNLCPFSSEIWPSPAFDGVMFQQILLENRSPEDAWKDACGKMQEVADRFHEANPGWSPEVI